jgi:hypothetical protein
LLICIELLVNWRFNAVNVAGSIPMRQGFMYLTVLVDVATRRVMVNRCQAFYGRARRMARQRVGGAPMAQREVRVRLQVRLSQCQ